MLLKFQKIKKKKYLEFDTKGQHNRKISDTSENFIRQEGLERREMSHLMNPQKQSSRQSSPEYVSDEVEKRIGERFSATEMPGKKELE